MQRRWLGWWTGVVLCLSSAVTATATLETAAHYIEQGYALLIQAHASQPGAQREQRLHEAIAAFKQGYQHFGSHTQVQALLGAAQGYLYSQTPRRTFPFLWQASPVQRAEKTVRHVLVLQPQNAAATLLLGLVYARQATAVTPPHSDLLAQSQKLLMQASAAGIPIHLPSAIAPSPPTSLPPPLHVHDVLIMARYVDARGTGHQEDLLLVYQSVAPVPRYYGVVVSAGRAYPLVADPDTGAMLAAPTLTGLSITPRPEQPPILEVQTHEGNQLRRTRFVWDNGRFVPML